MRPCANSVFDFYNLLGIKLLIRLCLSLSHLHKHKFKHCFLDTSNPLCECGKDFESTMHFFLHCTNLLILFPKISNIDGRILKTIKTITLVLAGLSLFQPSNTQYRLKDSNARFWLKFFCEIGWVQN